MGNSVVCPLSEYVIYMQRDSKPIKRAVQESPKERQKYYNTLGIKTKWRKGRNEAAIHSSSLNTAKNSTSPQTSNNLLGRFPAKSKCKEAVERGRALSENSPSKVDHIKESYDEGSVDFEFLKDDSFDETTFEETSMARTDSYFFQNEETGNDAFTNGSSSAKDHTTMRQKYLCRLTQEKVWLTPNEKPRSHQSVVIFDWDDTLLCTSYLLPSESGVAPACIMSKTKEALKKLEKKVIKIIEACISRAQVFIITNALNGWVQDSCKLYYPKLFPLLAKVTIISARSKYENDFPTKVNEWKMHAFLETKENLERGAITNIIAVGDSQIELDAAHNLSEQFPMARIKTIKLKQSPTPDDLNKELKALLLKVNVIIDNGNNMSIKLEKKTSSTLARVDIQDENHK